jgi:alpha-1,2-mannosyltransferase
VASTPTPRAALLPLVLAGLVATALLLWRFAQNPLLQSFAPIGGDFFNVWVGPRVAALDLAALFSVPHYMALAQGWFPMELATRNWSYPLYTLFFYAPFSWSGYLTGLALWSAIGLALYLLVAHAYLPAGARRAGLLCLALSPFALLNLWVGQNGFFTAALQLAAITCLGRRPVLAGVLVGLLCVKPHLAIVWPLALLALGAWRSIAAAALTVLLCAASSLLLHGVDAWVQYLQIAGPFQAQLAAAGPEGGVLRYYQLMLVSPFSALRLLGVALPWAMAAQVVLSIGVLAACAVGVRRHRDALSRALLIGSAGLLITPYAFHYDMGLLNAALVAWLVHHAAQADSPRALLHKAAFLLPVWVMLLNSLLLPLAPLCLLAVFLKTLWANPAPETLC